LSEPRHVSASNRFDVSAALGIRSGMEQDKYKRPLPDDDAGSVLELAATDEQRQAVRESRCGSSSIKVANSPSVTADPSGFAEPKKSSVRSNGLPHTASTAPAAGSTASTVAARPQSDTTSKAVIVAGRSRMMTATSLRVPNTSGLEPSAG
jgi:hypothetical protein